MKKIAITSALVFGLVITGTAAFADSTNQVNANSQLICTPTTVTPTPSASPRPSDTSTATTSTATMSLPGLTCKWVTPTPVATPTPAATPSHVLVCPAGQSVSVSVDPTKNQTTYLCSETQPSVNSLSQTQRGYQQGSQSQQGQQSYQNSQGNNFNNYGVAPNPMFNSPQASEQYYNNLQNQMNKQKSCYQRARRQSRNYNYGTCGSSGQVSQQSSYGHR